MSKGNITNGLAIRQIFLSSLFKKIKIKNVALRKSIVTF